MFMIRRRRGTTNSTEVVVADVCQIERKQRAVGLLVPTTGDGEKARRLQDGVGYMIWQIEKSGSVRVREGMVKFAEELKDGKVGADIGDNKRIMTLKKSID
ncbi:hypothetical protein L2E82_47789 [Cichorium intybus]|uniref:Uncharacterized protein n=1 Tax=Cichorium intybus TaxID=13427 RepID=A0ACB8YVM8_CICIN|nr:hypothetical protein L2E82_47789 [Cichorium intybus]